MEVPLTIRLLIRAAATTAALALSHAALAQDATTTELPLGQPLEPQLGQTYVRETFTDWQIRCVKQEVEAEEPCQMYQLLRDAEGNSVAEFSAFALPPGQQAVAGATVITPLETALTRGVLFAVDDALPLGYEFDFCSTLGCYARLGLTEDLIDQMKNGAIATVQIVPFLDQTQVVEVSVSLKGFTAAYQWMVDNLPEG